LELHEAYLSPTNMVIDLHYYNLFDPYLEKITNLLTLIFAQVILGEKVAASKLTVFDITKQICDVVQARAEQGMPPCLLSMSL
jgi:hypothetical protein